MGEDFVTDEPHVVETCDDEGRPLRALEVSGTYQSATYLGDDWAELVFPYHELFDLPLEAVLADSSAGLVRVLVLGGGGYSYPKHLIMAYPQVGVDVVEVDSRVTELALSSFFLDRLVRLCKVEGRDRLRLVSADALAFLERCTDTYGLVVDDAFVGESPVASLVTPHALDLVRAHLSTGGCYAINVVSALEGTDAAPLFDVTSKLGRVFAHVCVLPCGADEPELADNNVVVASDARHDLPGAIRLS